MKFISYIMYDNHRWHYVDIHYLKLSEIHTCIIAENCFVSSTDYQIVKLLYINTTYVIFLIKISQILYIQSLILVPSKYELSFVCNEIQTVIYDIGSKLYLKSILPMYDIHTL